MLRMTTNEFHTMDRDKFFDLTNKKWPLGRSGIPSHVTCYMLHDIRKLPRAEIKGYPTACLRIQTIY